MCGISRPARPFYRYTEPRHRRKVRSFAFEDTRTIRGFMLLFWGAAKLHPAPSMLASWTRGLHCSTQLETQPATPVKSGLLLVSRVFVSVCPGPDWIWVKTASCQLMTLYVTREAREMWSEEQGKGKWRCFLHLVWNKFKVKWVQRGKTNLHINISVVSVCSLFFDSIAL